MQALLGSRWTRERFAKSDDPSDVIHAEPRIQLLRPVMRIHDEKHQATVGREFQSPGHHRACVAPAAMLLYRRDVFDLSDVIELIDLAVRDDHAVVDDTQMGRRDTACDEFLLLANLGDRIRGGPGLIC